MALLIQKLDLSDGQNEIKVPLAYKKAEQKLFVGCLDVTEIGLYGIGRRICIHNLHGLGGAIDLH